jgi:hypothetical protein
MVTILTTACTAPLKKQEESHTITIVAIIQSIQIPYQIPKETNTQRDKKPTLTKHSQNEITLASLVISYHTK